jgi:hypothetical protein
MHDDDSPRHQPAHRDKDDRDQEAIMWLLISEHPTQLTVAEIVRLMVPPDAGFIESDDIERGVRELVGMGLLHRNGDTIRPTRATLQLHHLLFE